MSILVKLAALYKLIAKMNEEEVTILLGYAQNLRFEEEVEKSPQTSGPKCKNCGAFTTYARVKSHGLCMKCERA